MLEYPGDNRTKRAPGAAIFKTKTAAETERRERLQRSAAMGHRRAADLSGPRHRRSESRRERLKAQA